MIKMSMERKDRGGRQMVGVAMGCSVRVEGRKRRRPVVAFSGRRVRPEEGKARCCLEGVATAVANSGEKERGGRRWCGVSPEQ
ncbi:hypothetical protein HAX54_016211 [Datura stramonium]|uniref:Uncharacterized protein n=1 Tax=Datura stramonium TaxID=4076 RepID=A0ABS8UKQ8_DATST|nr:hypothetical protein [Datura stramonium]